MLQNITVSHKSFNFNIFQPKKFKIYKKESSYDSDPKELEKERSRKEREISQINYNDPIFQAYNINIDPNNKLIGDSEYYRDIIREKMMIESNFRTE